MSPFYKGALCALAFILSGFAFGYGLGYVLQWVGS